MHTTENEPTIIYTIGHSNQEIGKFFELLKKYGIELIIDVRSSPICRYAKQFDIDNLDNSIRQAGFRYQFMGDKLGGKPRNPVFYDENGHVSYELISRSDPFNEGIDNVVEQASKVNVVIMCSEEDPRNCHRHLLVSQFLAERSLRVLHIRGTGEIESEEDLSRGQMSIGI